jgi:hypothetical protein
VTFRALGAAANTQSHGHPSKKIVTTADAVRTIAERVTMHWTFADAEPVARTFSDFNCRIRCRSGVAVRKRLLFKAGSAMITEIVGSATLFIARSGESYELGLADMFARTTVA